MCVCSNSSWKVSYSVPLRALVTEKYGDSFRVRSRTARVPVSSDYPLSDDIIAHGRWNIAVVVFDKVINRLEANRIDFWCC